MSLGDKLMAEHQERKDRDDLLACAMTIGKLREIMDNMSRDRDDVPVILPGEPLRVVTDWRGEWRGSRPVFVLYESQDISHPVSTAEKTEKID